MRSSPRLLLMTFLICSSLASADGGPPMITDDPKTVGANKWEINIAQLTMAGPSTWFTQSPYFDINYGVGDSLQLKYESGTSSVVNTTIPYGGSYATTGIRWKFFESDKEGMAMSTYPQYSFYPSYYGKNKNNVDTSQTNFFLPIEFSKTWGPYTLNPEIGYNFTYGDEDSWQGGLLLSRELSKTWSAMAEIHWQLPVTNHQTQTVFNIGTSYDLNETVSLLGSVGVSVNMSPSFLLSYIGIQLHL